MNIRTLGVFVAVFLVTLPAHGQAESLDSQFARFLTWWPGTYDNTAQTSSSPQEREADGSGNMATRLHIKAADLPAFGDHVVYAEWQSLDEPGKILRQRFYGFEIDHDRQALRLNLHIFPPDLAFVARTQGAHLDPSKVAGVTPADMVPLPGCDVFFTWTGDRFAGAMDKGACAFAAPGTDDQIYSWSQMRLTASTFEYLDGWFNPDGSVYMAMSDGWYVFERR